MCVGFSVAAKPNTTNSWASQQHSCMMAQFLWAGSLTGSAGWRLRYWWALVTSWVLFSFRLLAELNSMLLQLWVAVSLLAVSWRLFTGGCQHSLACGLFISGPAVVGQGPVMLWISPASSSVTSDLFVCLPIPLLKPMWFHLAHWDNPG